MVKSTAFDSPEFDALADRIGASRFMRKNFHRRYFKTERRLLSATNGRLVVFGAALYDMMTGEQRLAVAAHEFVHIKERDYLRNFVYFRLPPAAVWFAIAVWTLTLSDPSFGILLMIVTLPMAFFYGPYELKLLAAKHYREMELRCDRIAARYADGEALISALYLADPILNPPSVRSTRRYRNMSKLYPTLEERAQALRGVRAISSDDHDGHV